MNLKDTTPSKNFIDLTLQPKMLGLLLQTQANKEQDLNDTIHNGPPGGYAHWLTNELNNLSPEEATLIKKGFSLSDIYILRGMKKGQVGTDPSIPMYRK